MTKVCLIDGSGYIFRAFYALPNMTAPDGTPVNAVYGFITMFMRLLKNIPCDYCVVLFDAKRQNFRNQIFSEYKATRAEIPELLIPQFDLIHEAVRVLNLPYVLQEGYEADDLIATYAKQATDAGYDVTVVSGDKDLMQLINEHVSYYDGMKDKYFGKEDVKAKFGVYPEQVTDVQALSGDSIDNVPGVPGIGPKTAAELINTFGSLEELLKNADKIPQNKRRQTLLDNIDSARISYQLVKLKDDVPVEHNLQEFACVAPNLSEVLQFIDRLGFKSIRPKIEQWVNERCSAKEVIAEEKEEKLEPEKYATAPTYAKITTRQELEMLYREILKAQKTAFYVLQNEDTIIGISFSVVGNTAYYLPWPQPTTGADLFSFETPQTELETATVQKFLVSLLNNDSILKIAHGLKTQWHRLNKLFGQQLNLFPYDDVALMSYCLDSSEHEHGLPNLSELFLHLPLNEPQPSGRGKPIDYTAPDVLDFAYKSVDYVLRLYNFFKKRLFAEHKNYVYEILDRRLLQVLLEMEEAGIIVNEQTLQELDSDFKTQLTALEQEIYTLAGEEFNISSPQQIGELLYGKMGLKGKKTSSGRYNTSAQVLEQLAEENEIAAKILEYRTYAKLKSTYTTALLEARDQNNRVHTTFSQTVVNTGRLASSEPNLQNIPNRTGLGQKIRECFVAQKGYKIVAADYSQMELRLLASVADVKALKEAFAQGVDIHAATAARVFGLPYEAVDKEHRRRAKAINFGIVYGISQFGLARQLGIRREEAQQYIDSYFRIMPEVRQYMNETIEFAREHGYVETPMGRKCSVFGINSPNGRVVSFAERAAINAPIQGGAADIVKLAMQRVAWTIKEQNLPARMLLQVHDELVLEVREDAVEQVRGMLKQIMENVTKTSVPMVVDVGVGDNWHAAH